MNIQLKEYSLLQIQNIAANFGNKFEDNMRTNHKYSDEDIKSVDDAINIVNQVAKSVFGQRKKEFEETLHTLRDIRNNKMMTTPHKKINTFLVDAIRTSLSEIVKVINPEIPKTKRPTLKLPTPNTSGTSVLSPSNMSISDFLSPSSVSTASSSSRFSESSGVSLLTPSSNSSNSSRRSDASSLSLTIASSNPLQDGEKHIEFALPHVVPPTKENLASMVTIEVRDDDQLTVSEHLGSLSISEGSISTLTSSNRRKRGSFAVSEASSERTLGRVNLEIQPPRKENLPKPVEFLLPEDDDQLTVSDHFSESQYSPSASGKAVLSSSSNHSKGSNTSFKVSEKDLGKTGAPKISSLPYTSTTTSKIPPLYLKGKKANPQETIQACIASYQSMKHPSESGNAIVRQMSDIIQRYFPAGQKMMNIIQLEYGIKFRLDGLLREEATIKKEEAQIENDEAKIKKDEDELNENPVSTQQNKEAALRQLAEAPSENVQYIIQLKEYLAELESDENTIAELKAQIAISKADIQLKKAEIQMRKVRISQARNAIKKDGIRVCKLKVELNLDVDSSIDYCEWFQNFHALLSLNEKPISAEERQKALDNAELGLNSVTAQK